MPNCAVPGCTASGVHLFPKDETLKKKWEYAICRENYVATQHSRLCRNHFLDSDYVGESAYTGNPQTRKFLKKDAVPSIFPWCTWESTPTSTNEASTVQEASIDKKEFEVCRVCLALDVKMYDMKNFKLSEMFENVTGILDSDDKATKPQHICLECAARLKTASAFKDKALLSNALLKDYVHVTKKDIVNLKDTHISLKSQLTVHTTSTYIECEYSEPEINNETDVKEEKSNIKINEGESNIRVNEEESNIRVNEGESSIRVNEEESNIRVNEEEKETVYQENEPWIDLPLKIKMEYDPIANNDINSNDGQDYDDEITNIDTKTKTYIECEYSEPEINNETDVKESHIRINEGESSIRVNEEESNIRVNEEEKETVYQENEPWIDLPLKIKMEYDPIANNDINSNDGQDNDDEITNIDIKTNNEMANVLINHTSLVDDIEQKPRLDDQIRIDFESLIQKAKHNKAIEEIIDESPKKKYKMTNSIKEKILEMKSNGAATRTIADETGLSVSAIDCWWGRYRKSCPIYQRNLKIKRIQQSAEHSYQYKPEPGKEMEECSDIVRQRLHEAGLEHILLKKPEKNPSTLPFVSHRKTLHDVLKKRIIALKQEGITNTLTAYLLDTSPATVRKWWARWCEEGHMQNQPKGIGRKRRNSRRRSALDTEDDA